SSKIKGFWLTRKQIRAAAPAVLRGTALGSMLGILPGGGAMLSAFASYAVEKKLAKDPSQFGRGAIQGVAGPESANNAGAQTAFFGFLGVLFMKLECEPAPLLLGFVLGPMMEENLRRALLLSRGDPFVFVQRPISAGLLIAAVLLIVVIGLPNIRKKREE